MSMFDDVLGLGRTGYVNESVDFEPELENCTLESAEDLSEDIDLNEFMLEAAFNTERNMSAIDAAIMCEEYAYLLNHGTEMVYEAGSISNIVQAARNAVLRAWDTIQKYLKAVRNAINTTAENSFIKKYENKTKSVTTVKIKGSDKLFYNPTTLKNAVKVTFDGLKKCAEDLKNKGNDFDAKAMFNTALGVQVSDSKTDEYKKAIDEKIGIVKKSDMKDFDAKVQDAWTTYKASTDTKTYVKDLYDKSKKATNDAISALKLIERDAKTKKVIPTDESKKVHEKVKAANMFSGLLVYANRAAIKFVNQGKAQAKAVILGAVRKAATGEGATVGESTSFLANIDLV